MKKNIAVSNEVRQKLMKIFNVTDRTVRNALNLDYPETDVIKRMRKAAMENGGVVMATVPEGEAIFFADGTMRMDFANGAYCEFYRTDGTGHLFHKGKEVGTFNHVDIKQIFAIKRLAASLR